MFFNALLNASERFRFYLDASVTHSAGSYESFGVLEHDSTVPNQNTDYSLVNEYSDLDYSLLELTYGVSFRVDASSRLYGSVTYMDLTDDQAYVYGDQDGDVTVYSAGMTVGF